MGTEQEQTTRSTEPESQRPWSTRTIDMNRDQATPKDRGRLGQHKAAGEEKKELSENLKMSGIYIPWRHIAIVVPFWFL
jgi:hypothetical protein